MHEWSLAQTLCDELVRLSDAHRAVRVRRVRLQVGVLANVVPELLHEAFTHMRRAYPQTATTELDLEVLPLVLECPRCGRLDAGSRLVLVCPRCRSTRVTLVQGEELHIRDVELELQATEAVHGRNP